MISILICVGGFAAPVSESAISKPLSLGDTYIDEYLANPDYNYQELNDGENWFEKLKRKVRQVISRFFGWLLGDGRFEHVAEFIFQALPYIAILVLSGLLIWLVSKYEMYPGGDKKLSPVQVGISDDQAIMERSDIQQLIEAAVAKGDYRSAVRYSYLQILKKMKEQTLIDWKIQKTNHEYVAELPDGGLKAGFAQVTRVYDYIWYGGFELDRSGFDAVLRSFHQVEKEL
ncbi:MAG: DUF4129 domain-containing protein [Mongoliitalea sp.]